MPPPNSDGKIPAWYPQNQNEMEYLHKRWVSNGYFGNMINAMFFMQITPNTVCQGSRTSYIYITQNRWAVGCTGRRKKIFLWHFGTTNSGLLIGGYYACHLDLWHNLIGFLNPNEVPPDVSGMICSFFRGFEGDRSLCQVPNDGISWNEGGIMIGRWKFPIYIWVIIIDTPPEN